MTKELMTQGQTGGSAVPFEALHRAMDRLFDDFTAGWGVSPARFFEPRGWSDLTPRVDVSETEKEVVVKADLPGMDEKDIGVELTGDTLTLKGEKKSESEEKGKHFYRMERSTGTFQRTLALPAEVDPAKVEATFKKGVLTVTLAKTTEAQEKVKKIEVKGS